MNKQKSLLESALEYHDAGINVMVAYYRGKSPPRGVEWSIYQDKQVQLPQLHEWFGNCQWRNISGIAGPISGGLTIVDFDVEKTYHRWAEKYLNYAKLLPTVKSARGYHVYMRSELTKDDLSSYPKIDIKAKGLFSLPPSMHKSGIRYEWINPLPEHVSQIPLINPHDWNLSYFTDGNDGKEGKDGKEGMLRGVSWKLLPSEVICLIEDAVEKTLPKQYG